MMMDIDLESRLLVNRSCFGLNIQRAARVVAKKFDAALKPLGINHWQFSMLMTLSVPNGLSVGELASLLIVDRTTLPANIKPLQRLGLLAVRVDEDDARSRRIQLTPRGNDVTKAAFPIWQKVNAGIERSVGGKAAEAILDGLASIRGA
jgi:DNA-binding MarR family transcriptional regulator